MPISISSSRIVESGYVQVLVFDKPEIRTNDSGNGRQKDGVSAHEGEECGCRGENFPGHDNPASDDGGEDAAPVDVDPFGEEDCKVVCCGDAVGL